MTTERTPTTAADAAVDAALTALVQRIERHVDFECGANGRYAFMEEVRVLFGPLVPTAAPVPAGGDDAVEAARDAERNALRTGTHEPAVDDFGNQYLAALRPEPRAEGLDYGPLMTAVSILLSVTAAIMPESAPCHHDRRWLMAVLDDVSREYAALTATQPPEPRP